MKVKEEIIKKTVYIAGDGTWFWDEQGCLKYESEHEIECAYGALVINRDKNAQDFFLADEYDEVDYIIINNKKQLDIVNAYIKSLCGSPISENDFMYGEPMCIFNTGDDYIYHNSLSALDKWYNSIREKIINNCKEVAEC